MIYLDNGSTSFPKPESVYRKMDEIYRFRGANPGRAGHRMALQASQTVEEVRRSVAEFFHAPDPRMVAFTLNATDALNTAIRGVLKKGDRVVTTALEHNSVSRTLKHLEKELQLDIVRLSPKGSDAFPETIDPEDVAAHVNAKTRLVAVNHASNVTGWIQPVEAIGRAIKAKNPETLFLVDSAQTAGILPIDVQNMKIDLLAFTGHKALYGPTGSGGLVVSAGTDVRPFRVGGTGTNSDEEFQPEDMPDKLEAGTVNILGIIGLGEGIRFVREQGMNVILRKEQRLKERFRNEWSSTEKITVYTSQKPENGLGILSFNVAGMAPIDVASLLDSEFNIAVRAGLHCSPGAHRLLGTLASGTVRVSLGFFNTDDDCDRTIEAVKRIVKEAGQ
jgi:cysteine desulfurase / selenocysteine lyase